MKLSKKFMAIALSTVLVGGAFAAQYKFERKAPTKVTYAQAHKPSLATDKVAKQLNVEPKTTISGIVLLSGAPNSVNAANSYTYVDVEGDGDGTYNQFIATTTTDASYNDNYPALMISSDKSLGTQANLDDWVFIPVNVTVISADMNFSLDVKSQYSYSSDNYAFEVKFGKTPTPEGMTIDVLDGTGFHSKAWTTYSGSFSTLGSGQYYVGLHAKYAKSSTGKVWFSNINLTMNATDPTDSGITSGEDETVLFSMHPTEDEFNSCTVVDANNDGVTIGYGVGSDSQGNLLDWPILYNNIKAKVDADEWLITPAITLSDVEKIYTVAVEAVATGTRYTEAFEIALSTSPDVASMTNLILEAPTVTNNSYAQYKSRFGIDKPGQYYIGIHINSKLSVGWRIALRNFAIAQSTASSNVPGAVENLVVTPNAKGELSATATFNLPKTYLNGGTIPSTETISASVITTVETKTVSGKPGEQVSVTFQAESGLGSVIVTTKNDNGDGASVSQSFRCGLDEPVAPKVRYSTSEDNMTLNISWDPVTEGANGGVVDPDGVTYEIYQYYYSDDSYGWMLLKSGLKDTSYSFTATSTDQDLYEFIVSAVNEQGGSEGDYDCYASAVLGTPLSLPMEETFPSGGLTYSGLSIEYPDDDYSASWALDDPSQLAEDAANDSGYALISINQYEGDSKARLSLPKFSTVGNKYVTVGLSVFLFSAMPEISVNIVDNNNNVTQIGTISGALGYGWKEVHIDIPDEFINKPNLKVMLDMEINNTYTFFALEGYRIYERSEYDMRVASVTCPSSVKLGEDVTFTAVVESRGYLEADVPALKGYLYNGIRPIGNPEVTTSATGKLVEGDKITYTGTMRFDSADYVGKTLRIQVATVSKDNDNTNNSASADFKISVPAEPVITDLKAKVAAEGIALTWTDPYENGYKDNFEGYQAFTIDGVIGPWKNMDFDGNSTYSFGSITVPNRDNAKAFQIINDYELGYDGELYMPSGNQCLIVFSAMEAESDDWLVSPEVVGGSSVTFSACPLSEDYTESFEVLYSTTDDDVDSFKSLEQFELEDEEWLEFSVDLPADAKYFAIHYYSNDMFAMMIDDIIYSPVAPDCTVEGYDIYRNGSVFTHIDAASRYVDTNTELTKSYTYNIAATGTYGGQAYTFPQSNTVSCTFTGVNDIALNKSISAAKGQIIIAGYEGSQVRVYNLLGMTVADATVAADNFSIAVAPGNYIVEVDGTKAKLFVK